MHEVVEPVYRSTERNTITIVVYTLGQDVCVVAYTLQQDKLRHTYYLKTPVYCSPHIETKHLYCGKRIR